MTGAVFTLGRRSEMLTCRDGCAFLSGEGSATDTETGLRCVRSSFCLRHLTG